MLFNNSQEKVFSFNNNNHLIKITSNSLQNADCDVSCHKKCEKLAANLCGVNQKLIVEALSSVGASFNSNNNLDGSSTSGNTSSSNINNNNSSSNNTATLSYQKNSLIHGISDIGICSSHFIF